MTSREHARVLNDIAIITMGQSPTGETCNSSGVGMPLLNGPTEFRLRSPSPVQYTTDPKRLTEPGDLLFCVRGSTTGRMNWADQVYAIGRGIASIRGKDGYPTSYVRAVIETQLDSLLMRATGSTFPNVTKRMLEELPVPDHDTSTATAIADIFDVLEYRVWNLVQENSTLESIAEAMFRSWFIDFDPVHAKAAGKQPEGMDAETAAMFPSGFEDSELGSIPKGWAIDTIGNVIDTVSGTTPSTRNPEFWQPDEYWWATPKDLSGLSSPVLIKTERRISEAGLARISSGLLPKGTLLMSSRAPIGYLAIAQVPTAINQGFIGMLPGETLTPEYMLFWCRLNMETIVQHANGSTFLEISRSSFRRIQIVVPSAPLVSKFTEIAALLLQRIAENERYVKTLAELRDTLLPRLVSGKLRIPEAKELVEEAVS